MVIKAHAVISQFQKFFRDFILDVTSGKMKKLTFPIFSDFQIPPRSLSHNIFKRASLAAHTENSKFCVFLVEHLRVLIRLRTEIWNFLFFSFISKNGEIKISLPLFTSQRPPKNIFTFFVRQTLSKCCWNYCLIRLRTELSKRTLESQIQNEDGQATAKTEFKT